MGARHHAFDDAENALGKSGFRRANQIRRVTRDGKLRQPVFLGLREDKKASEVRREQ